MTSPYRNSNAGAAKAIFDVFYVSIALIVIVILFFSVVRYMSIPIVQFSHSTGECVRVISDDSSTSCSNLPKRYKKEWVK